MRNGLFRSTPFRLALSFGAAFVLALVVAGFVAFALIRNELATRTDQSLTDTFNVIAQAYGDSDQADLIDSVASHARATLNHDRVYALAVAGRTVAGNVAAFPAASGRMTVTAAALGLGDAPGVQYRVLVGAVEDARLLVGESSVESAAIARIALTSLAWAVAAIVLLVVATGVVIALRAQRRLDGIAATMQRVGHGELGARIPIGRRDDDIDMLARQVNAALDRLGGLVEGMRQVSVNIAHDLKTPLNRLAITVEGATRATRDGRPTAELLGQAADEIRQINTTFDALLRIAQIEAGARRARFVRVDMGKLLDRVGDAYVDVAEERTQRLVIRRDDNLPGVEGDADLLTQLCANLIENSMRHAPAGTQIGIAAASAGGRLVVTFSDDGPGIPEAERGKVLERLYRVEKSRTTPGSGLGLSLVKAIADLHGAEIAVGDNAPGLLVSVSFPAAEPRLRTEAGVGHRP